MTDSHESQQRNPEEGIKQPSPLPGFIIGANITADTPTAYEPSPLEQQLLAENEQLWRENRQLRQRLEDAENALALERQRAEKAEQEATHDDLTKLLNRRGLMQELEGKKPEDVIVMFIDLNHLKHINDTLGHIAGDRAIRHVAKILNRSVRSSNTDPTPNNNKRATDAKDDNTPSNNGEFPDIVARPGGDEFIIILCRNNATGEASIDTELVKIITDRINKELRDNPATIAENTHEHLAAAVGHAIGRPGQNFADLINTAEKMMYEDKKSKKNSQNNEIRQP